MSVRWNSVCRASLVVGVLFVLPLLSACGDDDDGDGSGAGTGGVSVSDVWSRPAILLDGEHDDHDEHATAEDTEHMDHGNGTNGVVYMLIENDGDEADRLVSVQSEIAMAVELHTSSMDGGVMQMRPVEDGVEIPAGETVAFEQGGYHVMLIGLHEALEAGDTFEVELTFEQAGKIVVESEVRSE